MPEYGLQLTESIREIETKIINAMIQDLDVAILKSVPIISLAIGSEIETLIRESDIYRRLLNGDLKRHFGLTGAGEKLDSIVNNIVAHIEVKYKKLQNVGNNIIGGIEINVLRSGFVDLITLEAAIQETEKGDKLPWLDWLLLQGNKLLIADYSIVFKPGEGRSGAIMIYDEDGFWKVPSDASGTINNNWLTRVLFENLTLILNQMAQIIKSEIERNL